MNTWFDLTTAWRWIGPPVGIVRTEVEIAKHFLSLGDPSIRFCRYDQAADRWIELSRSDAKNSISEHHDSSWTAPSSLSWERVARGVRRRIARLGTVAKPSTAERHPFLAGDAYVSVGMDVWDKNFALLAEIKAQSRLCIITTCYDLIPIRYPQLVHDDERRVVPGHLQAAARLSDCLMCISDHTRDDLQAYMSAEGIAHPTLERINLGFPVPRAGGASSALPHDEPSARFILCVSSLVRRKNHEVLYRAYRRLLSRAPDQVPRMLWVGKRSSEVSALLNDVMLDPVIAGRIEIRENVSDAELDVLYRDCLFTVYPTLCEGWGLPVAESTAYGKLCVTSDVPSVREIAPDLHDYLDPWDVRDWTERLGGYFNHPELIEARNQRVQSADVHWSWENTAQQVLQITARMTGREQPNFIVPLSLHARVIAPVL